jgi:hypothetical protein
MNIILCSGMMRSASTWSFNVCRLLAILVANQLKIPTGATYLESDKLDDFLKQRMDNEPGIIVLKTHLPGNYALELIHSNKIKNVCTIRDPRDCVASRQLFDKESFQQSINWIKRDLSFIDLYLQTNNTLFIQYEIMIKHTQSQIQRICRYLDIEIGPSHLSEIDMLTGINSSRRISETLKTHPPQTVLRSGSHLVDTVTHLHENHIQGGICGRWKTELTREQIKIVNKEFREWLIILGYETELSLEIMLSSS